MDAVGEPHLFQVLLQRLPFGGRAVSGVILIDHLQRAAHWEIDGAVLVEEDVAPALGRLGQIIDELLLLERQGVEAGDFVTDDLDVVETVDDPRRLALRRLAARRKRNSGKRHRYDFFHVVRVFHRTKIVQAECKNKLVCILPTCSGLKKPDLWAEKRIASLNSAQLILNPVS